MSHQNRSSSSELRAHKQTVCLHIYDNVKSHDFVLKLALGGLPCNAFVSFFSYVELATDKSVQRIIRAYLRHGGYNTLVLDWSNLAFGNYITVAIDVATVT